MSDEARRAIEAVLMVAESPVDPNLLAQLVELPVARVEELCTELAASYDVEGRGFVLARVAGGYRYQSHPDQAAYVERFVLEGQSARLSSAALETLSIVAYKQPISRAQVAAIRGVNVDGVMRTLQHRGYISEVARDPGPGQAVLFGTTSEFLERLGLDSLDDLPGLADFVPGPDVVEALEQGLRIEIESDGPGDDAPSDDAPVDAVPVEESTDGREPDEVGGAAVGDGASLAEVEAEAGADPGPEPEPEAAPENGATVELEAGNGTEAEVEVEDPGEGPRPGDRPQW